MSISDTLRATGALIIVLGIVIFLSWLFKKLMMSKVSNSSIARIVGGVSLGSRERLMVVEVGDRWLVVGVAPGHITALANLDPVSSNIDAVVASDDMSGDQLSRLVSLRADSSRFKNFINSALRK